MVVEIGIPAQHRSRRGSTFCHLPKNIANRFAVVLVVFIFFVDSNLCSIDCSAGSRRFVHWLHTTRSDNSRQVRRCSKATQTQLFRLYGRWRWSECSTFGNFFGTSYRFPFGHYQKSTCADTILDLSTQFTVVRAVEAFPTVLFCSRKAQFRRESYSKRCHFFFSV